jgi:hypothetical protein
MVKMTKSCVELNLAQTNFDLFCDTLILNGLRCLLLMLKSIHFWINFLQYIYIYIYIYIYDYVVVIKVCQGQLYHLYIDLDTIFVLYAFRISRIC